MSEIEKLRTRLKNVGRNVTQYNMTLAEARALIEEYDKKETEMASKIAELMATVERWKTLKTPASPPPVIKHIDGGSF